MTIEKIRALRQALLDNAAGHPLAQVHRNGLFELLEEVESFKPEVAYAVPMDIEPELPAPKPIKVMG